MATLKLIGATLGEFRVLEEIGRGGMAVVYKAWQPSLSRYIALKVLPPHFTFDATFVERFRREAIAAAQLQHPNIVTIYNVGEQDGIYYIAMSYITGQSLDQVLAKEGPLPLDRAMAILRQVAAAVDYAHARRLVHRDIKPGNILLGQGDQVTLTDFGLVKAIAGTSLTKTGMVMGSPPYMAPEQVRGREVGPAADRYALGVVLYEMLTGQTPFVGDTPTVLHAHVYDTPPPLQQLNRELPKGVDGILQRALAKDPLQRFRSAGEMVAALTEDQPGGKTAARKQPSTRGRTPARSPARSPARTPARTPARQAPLPAPPPEPTKAVRPAKGVAARRQAAAAPVLRRRRGGLVWILVALLILTAGSVLAWQLGGNSKQVPTSVPALASQAPAAPAQAISPTAGAETPAVMLSSTPTATRTATSSPSPTRTPTASRTPTPSRTATGTSTRTPSPTATASRAPTQTPVPTATPTKPPSSDTPAPPPSDTPVPPPTERPPTKEPATQPPPPTQPPAPTQPPPTTAPPTRTPRPP